MSATAAGGAHTAPRARPGAPLPAFEVPLVGGGARAFGPQCAGWHLLIVYRGRHCPRCKTYLARLTDLAPEFAAEDVAITVTSADPPERAGADRDENGWGFALGHSLSLSDMDALGLYVSDPRNEAETDRPFAEPGLYVVNPEGLVHVMGVSNAASCRPDLAEVLDGIKGVKARSLPIRGLRGLG